MPVSLMRRVWREGATRRVTVGSALAAAGGATIASIRHLHPVGVMRTSVSCALLTCPLFALREVVAGGLRVDGPVASAIAGGVAGYVSTLAFSSGSWKAVSHGAMFAGVSAGLVDVVVSSVDYQWKSYLIARRDAQVPPPMKSSPEDTVDMKLPPVAQVIVPDTHVETGEIIHQHQHQHQQQKDASMNNVPVNAKADTTTSTPTPAKSSRKDRLADLPVWIPSGGISGKDEYENLLQSQKVTAAALRQEQDRIARLLATIESLKNDGATTMVNNNTDITTDSHPTLLSTSTSTSTATTTSSANNTP